MAKAGTKNGITTEVDEDGNVTCYVARYSYTKDGKRRHSKKRFPVPKYTKKDAESWYRAELGKLAGGIVFKPSRESFGDALTRWLGDLGAPKQAPSTIDLYRRIGRLRFDPIREKALADITPATLKRLVASWEAELAPETVCRAITVMKGVFAMVTDEIGLRDNPADKIKRPKLIAQRLEIWTPDEIASFLRQTHDHEWGEAWQMLFATIMRIGELAALRWSDVDFDEGVVTVQRTWSRTEDGVPVISDRPKTHHGRRVVPLPADVVSMLDARMHRMGGTWIWGDPPPKPATLARAWSEDVAASELPRITPHGARHSGASNMVRAGVPVGVVQRIAGHSDPAFTLRKYVHHDNDDMRDAIDTLSGLYRGETTIARVQSASRVVPMRRKHSEKSEETGF